MDCAFSYVFFPGWVKYVLHRISWSQMNHLHWLFQLVRDTISELQSAITSFILEELSQFLKNKSSFEVVLQAVKK